MQQNDTFGKCWVEMVEDGGIESNFSHWDFNLRVSKHQHANGTEETPSKSKMHFCLIPKACYNLLEWINKGFRGVGREGKKQVESYN